MQGRRYRLVLIYPTSRRLKITEIGQQQVRQIVHVILKRYDMTKASMLTLMGLMTCQQLFDPSEGNHFNPNNIDVKPKPKINPTNFKEWNIGGVWVMAATKKAAI